VTEDDAVVDHERVTVVDVGLAMRRDTGMEDGVCFGVLGTHLMKQLDSIFEVHGTVTNNLVAEGKGKAEAVGIVCACVAQVLLARCRARASVNE